MPVQRPADASHPPPKLIVTEPPAAVRPPLSITVDGALIEEAIDSDSGNVLTLDRKDVAKRYVCRLPDIQDKPVKFLRRAFPIGSPYPGDDPDYAGLIVYGYDEGERINESDTAWHSTVIYSTLDQLAVLDWTSEGEFSDEQEHIEYDKSETYTLDTLGEAQVQIGQLIGEPEYEPSETGTYSAATAFGTTIQLEQTGAFRVTGFDRYKSVHRFSMVRTLFSLTWRQIHSVGMRIMTVNSERFLFYEPGELLFVNFAWREVYGLFPTTQSASNKNYEVRLQFAANSELWSPIYRFDHYEDPKGLRSLVVGTGVNSGRSVRRTFHPYQYSAFVGIFNVLNTGAPIAT